MNKYLICLSILFLIGLVSAVPLPHAFHGTVTYSSGGNVNGEVVAKIGAVEKGSANIINGVYDLIVETEESGLIYFYIEGNDSKLAEKQFTAFDITELNLIVPKEISSSSSNSNSPGGGGGSGSSSITTISPTTGTIFAVSESQITDGIIKEIKASDKIEFSVAGEKHTLNLNSITGNSVSVTVRSEPITFVLEIGDEKKIDFETDGFYDLKVKLEELVTNKAKIKIQSIHEKVPEQTTTTNQTEENNETSNGFSITGNVIGFTKSKAGIGLIIGIVIVIAGIGIIGLRKKRLG